MENLNIKNGIKYYNIQEFDNTNIVKTLMIPMENHMRFRIYSWSNGEDDENYDKIASIFNIKKNQMVRSMQEHTSNIKIITSGDKGLGITKKETEISYDGFITNEKNIMLLTVEADCTPAFILDTKNKIIAMIHSGWRGTVKKITINAILLMQKNYGTKKEDLIIHLGPSICQNCYEVNGDLINEFKNILNNDEINIVFKKYKNKFLLDVSLSIYFTLIHFGIKKVQITKSNICTFHDNIFSSWRRDHDKTSHMLTGIMLI